MIDDDKTPENQQQDSEQNIARNGQTDSEENTAENGQTEENASEPQNKSATNLYIAIGCFAAGVVVFILSVVLSQFIANVGVYMIIASMVLELAALSFLNAQKRIFENKLCKIIKYLSYAALFAGAIFIIVGLGLNASLKGNK